MIPIALRPILLRAAAWVAARLPAWWSHKSRIAELERENAALRSALANLYDAQPKRPYTPSSDNMRWHDAMYKAAMILGDG